MGLLHPILHFSLDAHLAPYIPRSFLPRLPRILSYPLGHHASPQPLPPTLHTLHATLSTLVALLTVTSISHFSPSHLLSASPLLPPLGAGAVLNYLCPSLPASQPRPTIAGQTLSAVIGVAVTRLFATLPGRATQDGFEGVVWLAAPVAVALAVLAMRVAGCVHPPGGATAALVVVERGIREVGWDVVGLVVVGTATMVGVGCVVNNLWGAWPGWWVVEGESGGFWTGEKEDVGGSGIVGLGEGGGESERAAGSGDEEKAVGGNEGMERARSNESQIGLRGGVCPCCGRGGA
ncbi:hypothetical protein CAC42_635 [Sphaceloma murrayae]|uniref:HPP transmembrane region domain-containing protein n=1 Tax=Sphaceloma murrayae TaxID=2082308 RepID=A0A2K1QJR2_9PEZI|nr:hypothetical protein CAC42_635 [Sphaceloma murrayae]